MSRAAPLPVFFSRNDLSAADEHACLAYTSEQYPGHVLTPLAEQGGCSYTVIARPREAAHGEDDVAEHGRTIIIQYRRLKHALPIATAQAASRMYAPLAPQTLELGHLTAGRDGGVRLQAVALSYISGECFSHVQPALPQLDAPALQRYRTLMGSLATFCARSWHAAPPDSRGLSSCTGKVGASVLWRLGRLGRHLPSRALRERAQRAEQAARDGALDAWPVVLTHGDFLPCNMLVERTTWACTGYVDWAEAEWLPFGMCLYGIEHVLGYVTAPSEGAGAAHTTRFVYYDQAGELRDLFWRVLEQQVPALREVRAREQAMLARDIGICLWKGFAWDDGSIDRVVDSGRREDAGEVACLVAFLDSYAPAGRRDSVMDLDPAKNGERRAAERISTGEAHHRAGGDPVVTGCPSSAAPIPPAPLPFETPPSPAAAARSLRTCART